MSENPSAIALNNSNNEEEIISNLIETARTILELDVEQSKEFFEKALVMSRNIQYDLGSGECLLELGKIHFQKDDPNNAFKLLKESALIFDKSGEFSKLYECCNFLSGVCKGLGNYEQALEAQLKALQAIKKSGNTALLWDAINETGDIYKSLKDYNKAIEYHLQALALESKLKDKVRVCVTNFYIGNCYNWAGELEKSFAYLDKSLAIADELNDPELQVKPTGSLAILFTKMKEYDRATDFFYKAVDYVNITGDLFLKADILRHFGNLFIEKNQLAEAIQTLQESLEITKGLKAKYPQNFIHQSMAEAYSRLEDYKKAFEHYKIYTALSAQMMNEEVAVKTKGLQLLYDFEDAKHEKALAEKAVNLKDQFIANISYEIRTPLNDVLGMADLLSDTNPTPEQIEYINTIKLSTNNLIFIINEILDYSKIQSGEIAIEKAEFKIRSVLAELAQIFKVKADEKKIQIFFSIDDLLPDILIGDAVRLKQILMNLLNNAIKFTERGSVNVDVQLLQGKGHDAKVLFTVSDTGLGIHESEISSIFESFTQLHNDRRSILGGAGLGLAIVKQLVELKGGSINVNSKEGVGSVFKIELPFHLVTPIDISAGTSKARKDIVIKDFSEVVILLVEDNKVNQFLAQKLLNKMGLEVVIANNGAEALEKLQKDKFDLILMDVQMPEMNGYELTELIRSTLPPPVNSIPIIALTAYASAQEKEKAMMLGMSDYITKPYSPHELTTAILKQINSHTSDNKKAATGKITDVNAEMIRQTSEKLILLFSGSVKDVTSLLQMLVVQIPLLLAEAARNIESKNWPSTFQTIHKLKSSVNLIKIEVMVKTVTELEELSRDQVYTERIPAVFEKFRISCEQAVGLMKEEVIRLKKL